MMIYIYGFILFVVLLPLGLMLHWFNLKRRYDRISKLSKDVSKEEFFRELRRFQGPNFTALALTAWMLLFTAFFYLYFFSPTIQGWPSYFDIIVSGPMESSLFAIIIMVISGAIFALLPENYRLYNFYNLSKNMKMLIIITVPVLLISIFCSIVVGIRHTNPPEDLRTLALLTLLFSEVVLLSPVIQVLAGVKR